MYEYMVTLYIKSIHSSIVALAKECSITRQTVYKWLAHPTEERREQLENALTALTLRHHREVSENA